MTPQQPGETNNDMTTQQPGETNNDMTTQPTGGSPATVAMPMMVITGLLVTLASLF